MSTFGGLVKLGRGLVKIVKGIAEGDAEAFDHRYKRVSL